MSPRAGARRHGSSRSVVAAILAVLLSWLVASRINRPIAALVNYAQHADSSVATPPPTPIAELETLRRGFVAARTALIDRAQRDELTGLPNRSVLRLRLAEAVAQSGSPNSSALIYLDLDRFKQANDTYGHAVGDAVLRLVAARLRAALRPEDLAARLGGDEFAVVVGGCRNIDDVLPIANRIVTSLHAPYDVEGARILIGASAGIVVIGDDAPLDEIVRRADSALYDAKTAGRGRCAVYDGAPTLRRSA